MNKKLPVNWKTITAATILGFLLIGMGTSMGTEKEVEKTVIKKVPEIKYKTVTKEVPGPTKFEMPPECRTALVDTTQNMADWNELVGNIGGKLSDYAVDPYGTSFDDVLGQQQDVISRMLDATSEVVSCDPSIGDDINIPQ